MLITGGTGSFGRAFALKLLKEDFARKVIIFSRDEWKQWEMQESNSLFKSSKARYFLGDVRDEARLRRAFHEVDYVVHAAALKQVPAAEYNPSEFVKTNVIGAMHIIDAAIDCGVKKVITLSTDKSVNPINLYGATKLCSDKLFQAGNAYVGARGYPIFSIVRYGNVLASRGSLIPHWKRLVRDGAKEIPLTDEAMTRFWITLDHATDFVEKVFSLALGGEIFIPKAPSMRVKNLAEALFPDLPIKIIGIRPGEKVHELLISQEEAKHTFEEEDHYTIIPEIISRDEIDKRYPLMKKPLPEDFSYASNTNPQWLGKEELRRELERT